MYESIADYPLVWLNLYVVIIMRLTGIGKGRFQKGGLTFLARIETQRPLLRVFRVPLDGLQPRPHQKPIRPPLQAFKVHRGECLTVGANLMNRHGFLARFKNNVAHGFFSCYYFLDGSPLLLQTYDQCVKVPIIRVTVP